MSADPLTPITVDRDVKTGYCTEPCSGCPWRVDTDMSIIPEARHLCGSPEAPLLPGTPMMPCHKKPKDGADQNLCAAWLALYGWHHIGIRIMVHGGKIPSEALRVNPDWPELHPDVESIINLHGSAE